MAVTFQDSEKRRSCVMEGQVSDERVETLVGTDLVLLLLVAPTKVPALEPFV
jgi:hypothetical protein